MKSVAIVSVVVAAVCLIFFYIGAAVGFNAAERKTEQLFAKAYNSFPVPGVCGNLKFTDNRMNGMYCIHYEGIAFQEEAQ